MRFHSNYFVLQELLKFRGETNKLHFNVHNFSMHRKIVLLKWQNFVDLIIFEAAYCESRHEFLSCQHMKACTIHCRIFV